jgi:hypothetical protein
VVLTALTEALAALPGGAGPALVDAGAVATQAAALVGLYPDALQRDTQRELHAVLGGSDVFVGLPVDRRLAALRTAGSSATTQPALRRAVALVTGAYSPPSYDAGAGPVLAALAASGR